MIALLALASAQVAVPTPPPGLVFGFFRVVAFQSRARSSGCGAGDLDQELETIRRQLSARFGKKAFETPKVTASLPGECAAITNVYRVNMADFRQEAAAALAPSPPAASAAAPTMNEERR